MAVGRVGIGTVFKPPTLANPLKPSKLRVAWIGSCIHRRLRHMYICMICGHGV